MSTLVRHFGDLADGQTACGICDFCDPADCAAQRFRTATEAEQAALFRVLAALRAGEQKSTGKLHAELFPEGELSRDTFEDVLGAMARAGLARLSDAVFEKAGKQIPYRLVKLTPAGRAADRTTPIDFIMKDTSAPAKTRKHRKKTPSSSKRKTWIGVKKDTAPKVKRAQPRQSHALRKNCVPGDCSKHTAARCVSVPHLQRSGVESNRRKTPRKGCRTSRAVSGIGISAVEKYGQQIYRI